MHAEIIAIGDEITSGQLLDTNTQWLSQRIEALGMRVLYHTTVGDDLPAMTDVFRRAIDRADVVVATGGLGPTADDLTRRAMADATARELVFAAEVLAEIEALFKRRGRSMPEQNRVQAMFPRGSLVIANPHGTAPGVAASVDREGRTPCHVFALPGVPAEMRPMFLDTLVERLHRLNPNARVRKHRLIKCFGAGESQIEAMLPDMIRRGRIPRVGITASQTTIILRITAEGETDEECDAAIEPTVRTIRESLGSLVFGVDDDELPDAVGRLLHQHGKTLAVAEWGTAGLLADWLGEIDQPVGFFLGGVIASDRSIMARALGRPDGAWNDHPAESAAIASAMASTCREHFRSDLALAIGRFPHFDPDAPEPAMLHVALADVDAVHVESFPFAGHPALLKTLSAKRALNIVRLALR